MSRKVFYHGDSRRRRYFEGWYLKHEANGSYLAVIPGIYMDSIGRKGAFIQVLTQNDSFFVRYPMSEFHASRDFFAIKIGTNYFTKYGIVLDIDQIDVKVKGAIAYHEFHTTGCSMMGPFAYLPILPCNHDVISMKHDLVGKITVNEEEYDFTGGTGYIETDWGRSFPATYAWTQCHISRKKRCSIMMSIAALPWAKKPFYGCVGVLTYRSKQYRIASYLGARVVMLKPDKWMVRQGKFRFLIEPKSGNGMRLMAPESGSMNRTVKENICSTVRYRIWFGEHMILDQTCRNASFEYLV